MFVNSGSLLYFLFRQYFDGVPDADEIKPETTLNTKSKYGNYSFKVSDIYNGNVNGTLKYTPYRDADNVKVPVPEGFTVSTKTGENTVKNGLVIKDSSGNSSLNASVLLSSSTPHLVLSNFKSLLVASVYMVSIHTHYHLNRLLLVRFLLYFLLF